MIKYFSLKKHFTIFLMAISCLPFAQTRADKIKEIDSLVVYEAYRLRTESLHNEAITLSQKIINKSKEISYKKGEAWGYSRLGNAYCNLRKYKESLFALNQANELSKSIDDNALKASIANEIGRNYNESNVSSSQAIEKFKSAITYAKKIEDQYDRETYLLYAYKNLSNSYLNINQQDVGVEYIWKSLAIEEDAYSLNFMTHYHFQFTKNTDSILHYLQRSTKYLNQSQDDAFEKSILANQWGEFYEIKKQFDKALTYYLQAEKLSKASKLHLEYSKSLKGISRCYESMGDFESSTKYVKKYAMVQDSIHKANKDQISYTVNNIVQSKEESYLKQLSTIQKIFFGIILLALILITTLAIKISINRRDRQKTQELVAYKEEIIHQQKLESQELKQKVNDSFEEVIELAKSNSPEFFTRFREVYPEIVEKLLAIDPKFRISELTLCAYFFLGFTSKDISKYTFKSINTVRNRRQNLRAKLNISGDDDIILWLKNLSQ